MTTSTKTYKSMGLARDNAENDLREQGYAFYERDWTWHKEGDPYGRRVAVQKVAGGYQAEIMAAR